MESEFFGKKNKKKLKPKTKNIPKIVTFPFFFFFSFFFLFFFFFLFSLVSKRKLEAMSSEYYDVDSDFLISESESDSESDMEIESTQSKRNHQGILKVLERSSREMYLQLYEACSTGDMVKLSECIYAELDLNRVDSKGRSPFYIACANGKAEVLKTLIKQKINLTVDPNIPPFFDFVVKENHHKIVAELLRHDVDVENLYPNYDLLKKSIVEHRSGIAVLLLTSRRTKEALAEDIFQMVGRLRDFAEGAIYCRSPQILYGFQELGFKFLNRRNHRQWPLARWIEGPSPEKTKRDLMLLISMFCDSLLTHYHKIYDSRDTFYCSYNEVSAMIVFELNQRTRASLRWFCLGNTDKGSILSRLPKDLVREIGKAVTFLELPKEKAEQLKKSQKKNFLLKKELFERLSIPLKSK